MHDGLENIAAGLGTNRDKRSYAAYASPKILTQQELDNMYRSSWLAKRIINAIPDDMVREWRSIYFGDDSPEYAFAVEQLEKNLCVRQKVNEALRWSRLYGGALLIIGTKDKDLSQPLDVATVRKGALQWLRVVDRWRASADATITTDISSDNFLYPEFYMIADSGIRVHHSRVIRFDGQPLPHIAMSGNGGWNDSELLHIYDSIINYDSTAHGIATMVYEANVDVIEVPELNDILAMKDGENKIIKRFQVAAMMKSYNRTLIIGGGEKFTKQGNNFSNLDKILQCFVSDVCGACNIPVTRLFGQSPGGLNASGDSDITHYYDMISSRQESDLRGKLEYLDEVLVRSALGGMPPDYRFEFNSLYGMTDSEVSEIQYKTAQRDKIYMENGVVSKSTVAKDLKEQGTYKNLTDEEIAEVEAEEELVEKEPEPVEPTPAEVLKESIDHATLDLLKSLAPDHVT
jgi:phage-related protein (TIGR01555 family)